MDLKDIKTTEDVKRYIDGCLNDYEAGIATKEQTAEHIGELITKVIALIKINNYDNSNGNIKGRFKKSHN